MRIFEAVLRGKQKKAGMLCLCYKSKIKDQGNMQEEVFKHSVEISKIYSHHFFCKKYVKSTQLSLNFIISWFHEIFCMGE